MPRVHGCASGPLICGKSGSRRRYLGRSSRRSCRCKHPEQILGGYAQVPRGPTVLVATLAALLAAALFGVSTALQHRSAGLVTDAQANGGKRLVGFISGTLRHPLWITGTIADIGGFALHAFA